MEQVITAIWTKQSIVLAYQFISFAAAVLCLIELIRIVSMLKKIGCVKLQMGADVVANVLIGFGITLILLMARSIMHGICIGECGAVNIFSILNVLPIITFIYTLRVASRIIWIDEIIAKHGLDKNIWFNLCGKRRRRK